jgi:hypothetical protein
MPVSHMNGTDSIGYVRYRGQSERLRYNRAKKIGSPSWREDKA